MPSAGERSKNCSTSFARASGAFVRARLGPCVSLCHRDENSMPRHVAHPTDQHVGTKLRARRTKLGMSQSTLAEALGLTFQQVQKYEKGANRIGAGRLQQIAQILQMPVESFFEGLPHERGQRCVPTDVPDLQYVADYLATADGLQLAKAFMQIPNAKLRRSIVNLVEQLADSEDQ
jgi:transcriptional regulator with XRE-family HTH domain